MRIALFVNNWVGWQVAQYLKRRGEQIVCAVLHPQDRRKFGQEIEAALALPAGNVFDASEICEDHALSAIRECSPDIGVSAMFGYILKREALAVFPRGCVNLHPSYLPYNRGAHANVWPFIDGTPAGVSLHYIDEGIDTGPIIAQRRVPISATDTGQTLYGKLERELVDLFQETWPVLREGQGTTVPQNHALSTTHKVAEAAKLDEIDLDKSYRARDLLNILRARTFYPHRGTYYRDGDKKVFIDIILRDDEHE